MKRVCAWCAKDMGEITPEEPGIIHGICEKWMEKQVQEGRA